MSNEQQRHDISDEVWSLLEPHLPGQDLKKEHHLYPLRVQSDALFCFRRFHGTQLSCIIRSMQPRVLCGKGGGFP